MNAVRDAAREYVERGWHVIPLRPRSKEPIRGYGLRHTITDQAGVERAWDTHPDAAVAIALSVSGLVALDIDPRNGGSLEELARAVDLGSPTFSRTGGGGVHALYLDRGVDLRGNLRYAGIDGVDVKRKGYIVAPPSVHPSGVPYAWDDDDVDPALMPLAVVDLCRAPPVEERPFVPRDTPLDAREIAYIKATVTKAAMRIVSAREGERHNVIYATAAALGEFVGGGVLDRERAHKSLTHAAETLFGEALDKITTRTIIDGLDRGATSPRSIPDAHERARGLLRRIAASESPLHVLELYRENNPEIVREIANAAVADEALVAIQHVLDLGGALAGEQFKTALALCRARRA